MATSIVDPNQQAQYEHYFKQPTTDEEITTLRVLVERRGPGSLEQLDPQGRYDLEDIGYITSFDRFRLVCSKPQPAYHDID